MLCALCLRGQAVKGDSPSTPSAEEVVEATLRTVLFLRMGVGEIAGAVTTDLRDAGLLVPEDDD